MITITPCFYCKKNYDSDSIENRNLPTCKTCNYVICGCGMCQHCEPPTIDQVKKFAINEYERAKKHYENVLIDNPNDEFAKRMLEINNLDRRIDELTSYAKHKYY